MTVLHLPTLTISRCSEYLPACLTHALQMCRRCPSIPWVPKPTCKRHARSYCLNPIADCWYLALVRTEYHLIQYFEASCKMGHAPPYCLNPLASCSESDCTAHPNPSAKPKSHPRTAVHSKFILTRLALKSLLTSSTTNMSNTITRCGRVPPAQCQKLNYTSIKTTLSQYDIPTTLPQSLGYIHKCWKRMQGLPTQKPYESAHSMPTSLRRWPLAATT